MNYRDYYHLPFPRPSFKRKNILLIFLVGISASLFIILFEPFGIENTTGEWFVDLVFFSLGILFIVSVLFIEFFIPKLFPRPFRRWTIGKAILWYPLVIVFLGTCQFLYKSWWGGWADFTFIEFLRVIARILGISFIVVFFVLGVWQYFDRKKISLISSKETYRIKTSDGKTIILNLNDILFIASDDNYVDIHMIAEGKRSKQILRSSLKNIEDQIVNPLTPIIRCHRKYLINIQYFEIIKASTRKMTIGLKGYKDQLPVSGSYIEKVRNQLTIHP